MEYYESTSSTSTGDPVLLDYGGTTTYSWRYTHPINCNFSELVPVSRPKQTRYDNPVLTL